MSYKGKHVSVIIPAHNEEGSIANVIKGIVDLIEDKEADELSQQLVDEIIVCDNNSNDATASAAKTAGARVVHETQKGYGAACLKGIEALDQHTQYIVFVDGDSSVASNEIINLLDGLEAGADLVVGNRENDQLEKGALSIHQRFGNALATFLISRIWQQHVSDLGPFRAIRHSILTAIDMQDTAFGWTVEMQVKAIQAGFAYKEVNVTTKQRVGKSKISGTVKGTIGAGVGIFSKIFYLYWHEKKFLDSGLIQQAHKTKQ